jgi:hypothetical protein
MKIKTEIVLWQLAKLSLLFSIVLIPVAFGFAAVYGLESATEILFVSLGFNAGYWILSRLDLFL